jgi:hypothetical protein
MTCVYPPTLDPTLTLMVSKSIPPPCTLTPKLQSTTAFPQLPLNLRSGPASISCIDFALNNLHPIHRFLLLLFLLLFLLFRLYVLIIYSTSPHTNIRPAVRSHCNVTKTVTLRSGDMIWRYGVRPAVRSHSKRCLNKPVNLCLLHRRLRGDE